MIGRLINPSGIISIREDKELRILYVYIYNFGMVDS